MLQTIEFQRQWSWEEKGKEIEEEEEEEKEEGKKRKKRRKKQLMMKMMMGESSHAILNWQSWDPWSMTLREAKQTKGKIGQGFFKDLR